MTTQSEFSSSNQSSICRRQVVSLLLLFGKRQAGSRLGKVSFEIRGHGVESLWPIEAKEQDFGRRKVDDEVRADLRVR